MHNTGCFYYFLGWSSGRNRCRDHRRNVRGQGKSMVVLGLFMKDKLNLSLYQE